MQILAGTSGYAYKEWKGSFYPEDLPDREMFRYYVGRLPAVEVNNTFYRMPGQALVSRWLEDAPESFRLVLKVTRKVTHSRKDADIESPLEYLFRITEPLGDRVGAHLFQLPPHARADLDRLARMLALVPRAQKAAFEFRHESWFVDEVYDLLRAHDAALVIADGEKVEVPFVSTASWGYLRLRQAEYSPDLLRGWLDRVRETSWERAYVFFKHEDEGTGPRLAEAFLEAAGTR